eukprot:TRINITY_DN3043_c0_g1_i1.p1 TRINITY_DN3043_c0_g1~~TRINITY_DN3043_c0_g1_i1.p1  ORF type:complete len:149 (+),score=36.15 TRINITY_DN3043_c0_g1_i1:23-469(+)
MARRLQREFQQLSEDPLPWSTQEIDGDNLFLWKCTIQGPDDSPYKKGTFEVMLAMPEEYPFRPPKVNFVTKVYHPNILQDDGSICNSILVDHWSPQIKIHEVLLILRQMLQEPNIDSPLEEEVARVFRENRAEFDNKAKQWTKRHARR